MGVSGVTLVGKESRGGSRCCTGVLEGVFFLGVAAALLPTEPFLVWGVGGVPRVMRESVVLDVSSSCQFS